MVEQKKTSLILQILKSFTHFAWACSYITKVNIATHRLRLHNANLTQGQRIKMQLYKQGKMPHTYIKVFVQIV